MYVCLHVEMCVCTRVFIYACPWPLTIMNDGLVAPFPTPEVYSLHQFPTAAVTN